MKYACLLTAFLATIVPAICQALPVPTGPTYADMASWDVAGLKFGMTPSEAMSAARAHTLLSTVTTNPPQLMRAACETQRAALIRSKKLVAGTSPDFSREEEEGIKGKCIYEIDSALINALLPTSVRLQFAEDYPDHPGVMRLTRIRYNVTLPSLADRQNFVARLKKRYGDPTAFLAMNIVTAESDALYSAPLGFYGYYSSQNCWRSSGFGPLDPCMVMAQPSGWGFGGIGGKTYPFVVLSFHDADYAWIEFVDGPSIIKSADAVVKNENAQTSGAAF